MRQKHRTRAEMDACLEEIRQSPEALGRLELIACRPAQGERQILEQAQLDLLRGLVGDNWRRRPSSSTPDGKANPLKQITIMNARAADAVAGSRERWALAGDQLFVDLSLASRTLPPGSQLHIGDAVVEITEPPHTGCPKFTKRFGVNALRFVNSPEGRELNLRGVNARVVTPGTVRVGDTVTVRQLATPSHHS